MLNILAPSLRKILFLLIVFVPLMSQGVDIVNRINGGANIVYVDFSIPGPVIPLEIVRTYSSITAVNESNGWNGSMGWGWTSPFETSLTVTPERHVLLRDGASGNTVQFKPEKEDPKVQIEFMERMKRAYFEKKLGRRVSDEDLSTMTLPDRIRVRLNSDPQFREELATRYGVPGVIPKGELLVSMEYGYQTLRFKNNQWSREKDGIIQVFDADGRIVRQKDKNGYYFDYTYTSSQKLQLSEISAQDKTITLKFKWRQDRVVEIVDNRNRRSVYSYDSLGNMIHSVDSTGQTYNYKYESRKYPHLLTKIEYASESTSSQKVYREIRYDDNGLVVFQRDKDGSEIEYTYGKRPNDPENNFWTKSIRRNGGVSEEQYEEFFIKTRTDGSKYLAKEESRVNGATVTTSFTTFGKPSQIIRNGETTNFKYYDDGLLAEKSGNKETVKLNYDPRWKKITMVNQNGFVSTYIYDGRGNLTGASNTKKDKVALKYDKFGRISDMTDPTGQEISFRYGDQGKPTVISEKNVGTIKIDYDSTGKITRAEASTASTRGRRPTQFKSQEVVRRVMQGFQHLLDIIRPAGLNLLNT
jgi:YD repeat-containing protein